MNFYLLFLTPLIYIDVLVVQVKKFSSGDGLWI